MGQATYGRIPAKLNALFKLRGPEGIYRLVHITLTKCIGSPMPTGEEGMVRVRSRNNENSDAVVKITDIEGIAHLIPIDDGLWLVNNRIELHAWEDINDGF